MSAAGSRTHLPVAILAGGLATRLRPHTENKPKSLVEIAGKPFVAHQLELLSAHGISHVVLCVGYLGEMIQQTVGDGSAWSMQVQYVFDGPALLGTGGALRRARAPLGPAFFVLYGDSYLECDYGAVERAFQASGKLGLMTVLRNENRWDRSNVQFADGHILAYDKQRQTSEMEYIDYGLSVLSAAALDPYPPDTPLDLATVYQDLVARGELAGYAVTRRFYEIGSPIGLEETRGYLEQRRAVNLQPDPLPETT